MDFLDPLKRQRHRRRLLINYVLLGFLLIGTALVLALITNGYGFNTKTRTIVQNGLVFVSSQPDGAAISLNGEPRGDNTNVRLVLPAGPYKLGLKKDGYRSWQRAFELKEQAVLRLKYPLLIPKTLVAKPLKNYAQATLFATSPDRHWLLLGGAVSKAGQAQVDLYDTTKQVPSPKKLNLPDNLFSQSMPGGSLRGLEWSSDNRHLLAEHISGSSIEFVVIDRQQPNQSINLNKIFKTSPSSVSLRDKRSDQFFVYDKQGRLSVGLSSSSTLSKPFLKHVISYVSPDANTILFAAQKNPKQIAINIWRSGQPYRLMLLNTTQKPLLAANNFLDHSYFTVGVASSHYATVFRDPLDILSRPSPPKLDSFRAMKIDKVVRLSSSPNSRFIAASNGRQTVSLDLDTGLNYRYSLTLQSFSWADGYHLEAFNKGRLTLADFDGSNPYPIASSAKAALSPNYQQILNLRPVASRGFQLESLSLQPSSNQ